MRTKVLLSAVAIAAACAFTARAQNVYSLNVVGYINVPLLDGWNLVANQLDADGTGTNNTVAGVLSTNIPVNTQVSTWNAASQGFLTANYVSVKGKTPAWDAGGPNSMNPGQGAWVGIPVGTFGSGNTGSVTTVGQVLQGNLSNAYLAAPGGWSLLGNVVPISGGITSVLNYQPGLNDQLSGWDPSVQNFVTYNYASIKGKNPAWQPGEPQIALSQGFWLQTTNVSWTTNFTVQ